MEEQVIYDIGIAGGGLAGMIMAARLRRLNPDLKILVLEKESFVGGRIRSTSRENGAWASGLKGISEDLYNFWDGIMRENPEGADLPMFNIKDQNRLGILMAGKTKEVPLSEAFTEKGAKVFAGAAAQRDWKNVEALFDAEKKDLKPISQNFASAFKGNKRSPSAVVLENLARLWGVADLWSCQTKGFLERSRSYQQTNYLGDWNGALKELMKGSGAEVTIKTDSRILASHRTDDVWILDTVSGHYSCKRLVVAQPPWDASSWLNRNDLPPTLTAVVTRSKPSSLVVISDIMTGHEDYDFPDVLLIPAENVQVVIDGAEICFQATLDYELTMQAPAVVKAVKRLKRARKKFLAAYEGVKCEGDYLALIPVGWGHLTQPGERRVASKLSGSDIQKDHLLFCGDAYGAEFNGDQNFIESCNYAYEVVKDRLN